MRLFFVASELALMKGTVLLIVLVFVALITVSMIGAALLVGVYHQYRVSLSYIDRNRAYYAAEAGFRVGKWVIENQNPIILPGETYEVVPYPFPLGGLNVFVWITDDELPYGEYEVHSRVEY